MRSCTYKKILSNTVWYFVVRNNTFQYIVMLCSTKQYCVLPPPHPSLSVKAGVGWGEMITFSGLTTHGRCYTRSGPRLRWGGMITTDLMQAIRLKPGLHAIGGPSQGAGAK